MGYFQKLTRSLGLAALLTVGGCSLDLDSLRGTAPDAPSTLEDAARNPDMMQSSADMMSVSIDTYSRLDSGHQDAAADVMPDMQPLAPDAYAGVDSGVPDKGVSLLPDLGVDAALIGILDASSDAPIPCYVNPLDTLENIVAQNGVWSIDTEGYLKQTEVAGGYRMAYLDNATYADFDASIKVRVPSGFSGDAHTGLLFRYTRESTAGYDYDNDRGYILEIEEGDGSSFELVLEDVYNARLFYTRVDGTFDTWHTLRVRTIGSTIVGYFNGEEIFTMEDSLYSSGHFGFGSHASESHYKYLEVCPAE